MKRFLLILMSILMSFQFLAKAEVPIGHGITDLSATNSVTVSTFPWTENFDTYSSGTFPTDWYRPVIHNSYPSVVTAYSVSSPASLRFESPSATEPTYAITPQMDVDIHSLMVTFQLKAEYMPYSGSMHVGVMSDPNDTSTFELVQIITPTNSNFIEYEVFFSNTTLTGTGNHIAFKHVTNNSIYYYWLDDVEVDYIPTCPKPTNLNVVSSGTDQLEIGWQENGTATSWIVEHRTLTDTNWIAETASTNPYTIANLDPQTTYMIRVQSNCGTEVSDYSPILYAMTDCVPISTVPWSDYFDTYGTGTTVFPPCWTRNTTYADRPYVTSTNYSAPGSLYFYAGTSGTYNIAATPEFDVSIPINTLQAVFKYRTTYATDTLFVGVMTDPTDATTFEQIAFVTNPSTSTWYEKEVPFNNYTGTGQYIAFKVHYSSTYTYAYLDNLEIDLYSTCVRPTQVQVVSATTDELEIGWTENGTATNWIVEYKKVTESVWSQDLAYTNPHTLANLESGTHYMVRVKADCGGVLSSHPQTIVATTGCLPVETIPWTESFENLPAANYLPPCWEATNFGGSNGYTNTQNMNYTSYNRFAHTGLGAAYFRYGCNDRFFTPGIQLQAGVSYEFSFWYITDGYSGWQALESGVYSAQTPSALLHTIASAITLNNTTYQQLTGYFTPTADGVYYFGVYCQSSTSPYFITIDDFLVDFAPDCLPLTQLQVSNITGSSAYLSWSPAGTPDYFAIEVEDQSTMATTNFTTNNYDYILTGLNEQTDYSVTVYPVCTGEAANGETVQFRTLCYDGGDIIVGTPDANTSASGAYLPTYFFYNYALSEQIYDAAELSDLGDSIYGLAFQYFYSTSYTRRVQIYLGHTTKSTFTGTSDYVSASSLTKVYDGNVTWTNTNQNFWMDFNFTTPFAYNSGSNLVVVVVDSTGSYTSSAEKYRTHATQGTKAIYYYRDGSPIPITNPSSASGGSSTYRNNIKFMGDCNTVTCVKPNIILTNVDVTSATMTIVPGMYESSWEGEYKESTETSWTSLGMITDDNYMLDNLSANTTYQFRLRSDCGGGDYSSWKVVSFTTNCGAIDQLPFVDNFDTYGTGSTIFPTCWTRTTTVTDRPYITTTNFSSPGSLYFYAGSSGSYNIAATPEFDESIPINTLYATFKYYTSYSTDSLFIGVMTDPSNAATFEQVAYVTNSSTGTWYDKEVYFTNYQGTGQYIAFMARYGSTYVYGYLDNVTIDLAPTCPKPTMLAAVSVDENEIEIEWQENGDATTWIVEYKKASDLTWTEVYVYTTPSYTIQNLDPSTTYMIRIKSDCGGEESEYSAVLNVMTACGSITTLPWSDYFDTYGTGTSVFPPCWTRTTTYANRPYVNSTNYSPPGSLYFYAGTSGTYNIAATPEFDVSIPINTLEAFFRYRTTNSTDTLFIGVMTDPTNASTFEQVAFVTNPSTSTWYEKSVVFTNYTGTGQYIAFMARYSSTYTYGYLDNLDIDLYSDCARPTQVHVVSAATDELEIGWTENGTATSWIVQYKKVTDNTWEEDLAYTNPHTITNLDAATDYMVRVKADCGTETSTHPQTIIATTECLPFETLPWTESFEYLTVANTLPACWDATSLGNYTYTQITNYNSYNRNARTGTGAAYFRYSCNDRFFTPGFQLQAGVSYEFSFWYVTDGYSGWNTLESGVYSAQSASSLISTIASAPTLNNTAYQKMTAYFTPSTDGVYYFGVYCQATGSPYYLTLDDFSFDLAPDCLPLTQLQVSNIAGSSAYLTWSPAGTPDYFSIEIEDLSTQAMVYETTNNYYFLLTGLNELTNYSVTVYPVCSGQDGTGETVQFRTTCFDGGDIIVGTPDATTSTHGAYLPTYTFYNYSLTEQIYEAVELSGIGDSIYGLAFQYFFNTSLTRNIEIYLGHTNKTTFTGVSDAVPGSSLTMVYQGNVTWVNTNPDYWLEINFPSAFAYDSDSNLVVVVRDMTGSYTSSETKFRTHTTTGTKAIYFYQDGGSISLTSPSASSSSAVTSRNNIKFMGECNQVTCVRPNIILTELDVNSATMMIAPGLYETSWEGEYKEDSETTWTPLGTITNTTYLLDNLAANTTYQFRLRSDCGGGDYSSWKLISFTTLCGDIELLPFTENFDTYPSGSNSIPTCWTRLSTQGSYPYISTSYPISSPQSAYFYSYGTNHSTLILPPLSETLDITTLQVRFWARTATMGQQLEVGVMTDPTNINTFTLVGTATPTLTNTYQEFEVNFHTYTGTGQYIALRVNGTNTIYMDNFLLHEAPSCIRPSNISFSGITQTGATVSWLPSPTAISYEYVYGIAGINPDNETPVAVNDTFAELTGLTANTHYEVYVRSVCLDGSTSEWSNMNHFWSACDAVSTFPWTENFDVYGTGSGIFPPCWFRPVLNTSTPYPSIVSAYSVSSPGSLRFQSLTSQPTYAITPQFNVDINTLMVTFQLKAEYMPYSGNMEVGVMSDPTNLTTFELVHTITPTHTNFEEYEVMFSNTTLSGTGNYIAFRHVSNNDVYYYWLDNVEVFPIPSCPKPADLSSTNVTQTSLDLGWVEYGTATTWEVEYGETGFTQGNGTTITVTTNPASITGLTSSTCYDFYVRSVCGPGDESYWSNKATYCTSQQPVNVPFMIDFETASGFTFANNATGTGWYTGSATGVNNTTGGSNGLYVSSDNGVTNSYTTTSTVVWAFRDIYFTPSTSDYTLTFDWKCYGEGSGSYPYDYFNVYIGAPVMPVANTTGTITAPTGATALGTNLNQQTSWYAQTYTLSSATYSGQTMRLYYCWRNDGSVVNLPPAAIDNIEITSPGISGCLPPTNLAISNISANGATATWGGTATSWVFEYKTTAATTWTVQNVTTATYTMTGLQPSTTYETRVKANCADGTVSAYSSIVTFTTSATPCVTPTNLQVINITDQSALATWTAGGNETSWQVDYKLVSSTNWTTGTATTTSFAMTGLQSNSNYHVRVKAICTNGESAFTEPVPFTTGGSATYTITATAGPHGTITPSGAVTVNQGGSQTFTFTPEAGYRIDVVLVDNVPQVPVPESYTFENIQANHTIHVDFAEGIAENELSQYVTLYPNPTQSLIDLKLDRDYLGTTECRIYDMYGKLMRIMPIEEEITTIDVSDFAAGVYFVRLTTEQGQVSKRFVKK